VSRKVCVITGTRAEYGLMRWLMEQIRASASLQLQVVAAGMHLAPEFGCTYREIEQDGFTVDRKVELLLSSDTPVGVSKSIGLGVLGFAPGSHSRRRVE
jgi:GDP/UDP-N,N'-diacetylbacillosamine 2-epimerase (hydrolysing)